MMDSLRNAARSWVAKALLLLLVVSFGIWGVSRSLIVGGSDTVMTVGDQEISTEEFRLAYQRQLANLGRQFGAPLTPDQARAFGVENEVFTQLAAGAALDQLADNMNLGLSEDKLASLIADDPAFKNTSGQFDRNLFTSRLRNAGLQENDYIKERSKVAMRSQIVESVSDGFKPPKVLMDALKQYRDESRTVQYLLLSNANIDPVKAPPDDVLAKWFETVKSRYRAPEYRTFSYVKLQPADIADAASISDDQVRAEYEKRKDSFKTSEVRTIEQLTFPNKEMADAAAAQIKSGATTFDQVAADQGKTATDIKLGDFTKEQLPDATLADAAFKLGQNGGITPVVQGTFGPVILRVSNVRPETIKSFDAVKDQIRKDMAVAAASQNLNDVHDKFEDLRNNGTSLEDAAKQLNLKVVNVTSDASGHDQKDQRIADLPATTELLPAVFKTEVGADALAVSIGNDGYVWFDVTNIIPERERPLTEVHDKAVADWTADQQRDALATKATDLKARLDKGETLDAIAADLGIAVETKEGLRRNAEDAIFGNEAIAAAFAGPNGLTATALGADGESRLLMKVTDVQDTASDALAGDQQLQRMADAAGDDMLDQMVNSLKANYGVKINQSAAAQSVTE